MASPSSSAPHRHIHSHASKTSLPPCGSPSAFSKILLSFSQMDWRRIAHSIKVGLALALVSLSVLLQEVYEKLGHNALWAVLTVVVVFEFTVGGTLSKGLNRGLGTIMAASLGLFVDHIADFVTTTVEPYFVGCSVFVIGMCATYCRFNPKIKAKYDYGVVVFLLTFCLVVISGYRAPDSFDLVLDRVVTILVGAVICILVCVFIFPVWAGDDIHRLIIKNLEGLAGALEECVQEYFHESQKLSRISSKICKGQPYDDRIYQGYRGLLMSKQTEESLANFASWEPWHGRYGCSYPWKQLAEVGAILRHCAYTVSALHGCVLSEIQAPNSLRKVFADQCTRIAMDVGRVLREVADDIRHRRKSRVKHCMLDGVKEAVEELHDAVNAHPRVFVNPDRWPTFKERLLKSASMPHNWKDSDHDDSETTLNMRDEPTDEADSCIDIQMANNTSTETSFKPQHNQLEQMQPFPLQESIAFAESLSLANVAFLLIEVVARLDYVLDAVMEFQENAGWRI